MTTKKATYKYYEDNGGGLHLFIFGRNGNVRDGITNLEYATPGEYRIVKDDLAKHPVIEAKQWEGHMTDNDIDPQDLYDGFLSTPYAAELVCDNGILYPEKMGAAAQNYFGTAVESDARIRINKMGFDYEQVAFIFDDWADWFDHMVWLLTATRQEIIDWIDSSK